MRRAIATVLFTCPLLLLAGAAAQDPERPPRPSELLGGESNPQQEMMEIFARVERALREIDLYLSDAAAGDVPLALPEESGLDDLLRATQERSQSASRDMERLLELAEQQAQSSGGGGGQKPEQPSGESPLDESRSQQQQPESTPEKPEGSEGEGEQPQGQKPEDERPEGDEDSDQDPENRQGGPPPTDADGRPTSAADEGESWGELPPRVREVFRSQGGGDLPVQYRDWIDSYYRRLNRRP